MPSLTLFENTLLGALHNHSSADESRAAALQALEQVGLLDQADDLGSTLVPSQLRLLELARALAGKPRLLLLDEPFAGLDAKEKEGFVQVLRDQWSRGLTIVMVDHDIRTVAATVERLFVIDNGVHIADGDPQTVIREPQVISAYLGSKWQEHEHVEA